MDIVEWLRELRMSAGNADWNATIVNNRLNEAADEIERLRNALQKISKSDTCGCQMECVDMCRIAEAALKEKV